MRGPSRRRYSRAAQPRAASATALTRGAQRHGQTTTSSAPADGNVFVRTILAARYVTGRGGPGQACAPVQKRAPETTDIALKPLTGSAPFTRSSMASKRKKT